MNSRQFYDTTKLMVAHYDKYVEMCRVKEPNNAQIALKMTERKNFLDFMEVLRQEIKRVDKIIEMKGE